MKAESGDGSFLPPSLHLKLDLADGLQKLCEWGNFLLCLQIFNKVTTSSALSHSDNLLLDFFLYLCCQSGLAFANTAVQAHSMLSAFNI